MEQKELHQYLLELRDRGYAHSDADIHGVEIEVDCGRVGYAKNWVHSALGLNRVSILRDMSELLLSYIELEMRGLESQLVSGDDIGHATP